MERRQTIIDVYQEMGFAGDLLLLLFLVIFALGCVIQIRGLDQSWRKSFLIFSLLPMAFGVCGFCYHSMDSVYQSGQASIGIGPASSLVLLRDGGLPIIRFAAWLTIILLVFSAFLFIGKKKEEREYPEEKSCESDIPV